jgi:prevent-host-death family protein
MYRWYGMNRKPVPRRTLMERKLGITDARKQLADIVDRVTHKGDSYILVRHGEEAAAVVPIGVYRRWKAEREELFAIIREVQLSNPTAEPDEVMREVLEAQQDVRRAPAP